MANTVTTINRSETIVTEKIVRKCGSEHIESQCQMKVSYTSKPDDDVFTTIRMSKSDSQPWGFRLSGGVDYQFPLTVVRVSLGSLADKAGLQPGDVVIRLNEEPVHQLTHGQVHNRLVNAGNDFVLTIVRSHLTRSAVNQE